MLLGAIDRVELEVPSRTPLTSEALRVSLPAPDRKLAIRHGYQDVYRLHGLGIDAILYVKSIHTGRNKIQVIDSGEKSYSQIVAVIEAVVATAADELRIMRLDLCVDVTNLPVEWFFKRVRVPRKRHKGQIGRTYEREWRGHETLSFGARGNRILIYDKISELADQYKKAARKQKRLGLPIPRFKEFCGYDRRNVILTRIERQWAGAKVPFEVATLKKLKVGAENLNPFQELKIVEVALKASEPASDMTAVSFLKLSGLEQSINSRGAAQTRKLLNDLSPGNGGRQFDKLVRKLNALPVPGSPDLAELYKRSLARQLDDPVRHQGSSLPSA